MVRRPGGLRDPSGGVTITGVAASGVVMLGPLSRGIITQSHEASVTTTQYATHIRTGELQKVHGDFISPRGPYRVLHRNLPLHSSIRVTSKDGLTVPCSKRIVVMAQLMVVPLVFHLMNLTGLWEVGVFIHSFPLFWPT